MPAFLHTRAAARAGGSLALLAALLAGAAAANAAGSAVIDIGRGPVTLYTPAGYDSLTPTPLVLLLHGYSSTGQSVENWIGFLPLVDELGFLYAHPDGIEDIIGNQFWNATDACCDLFGNGVDDSAYLSTLIDEIKNQFNVDDARVYVAGHSNGGFMSYRMACDHAELIAAIASLAGATYDDPSDCTPAEAVDILQIHGTADAVISYNGGVLPGGSYPGAVQTVETWASYNGCSLVPDTSFAPLDIEASIPGAETSVARFGDGCSPGGSCELWTVAGGPHSPSLVADFSRMVMEFFYAHPKPTSVAVLALGPRARGGASLLPNTPNPFGPLTTLRYSLRSTERVRLSVYDAAGRRVRTLVEAQGRSAGVHELPWDGRGDDGRALSSGVYFVRLCAGADQRIRKIVLAR